MHQLSDPMGVFSWFGWVGRQDLQLPGKLSEDLALLPNLEEIRLEYNRLRGTIPASLGDLDDVEAPAFHGLS